MLYNHSTLKEQKPTPQITMTFMFMMVLCKHLTTSGYSISVPLFARHQANVSLCKSLPINVILTLNDLFADI